MSVNGEEICPKEKTAQSDSSFGLVKNNEFLARIVLLSVSAHVSEDGFIKDSALKLDDLMGKDGWSFMRKKHDNMPGVLAKHAKEKTRNSSEYGYAVVKVQDMRGVLDDNDKQAFCIIDDAKKNYPEHALAKESLQRSKSDAREIRKELLKCFNKVEG